MTGLSAANLKWDPINRAITITSQSPTPDLDRPGGLQGLNTTHPIHPTMHTLLILPATNQRQEIGTPDGRVHGVPPNPSESDPPRFKEMPYTNTLQGVIHPVPETRGTLPVTSLSGDTGTEVITTDA
jgi:hypothetical protein